MCGFSGIIAFNVNGSHNLERIQDSLNAVKHRGPDHQQIYQKENFAVCHARLSILDLSTAANQPMFDESNENFILHNGEIFNFLQLKKTLSGEGESFRTSSDTEVLLKLFDRRGQETFTYLDGFFATVMADIQHQTWYLARDPLGVKPLYYYKDKNIFAFSSELQGLLAFKPERTLDFDSIYSYLQLNYIPQPYTVLKNIRQVRPGHYLKLNLSNRSLEEIAYYNPADNPYGNKQDIRNGDAVEVFGTLFTQAVEKRLISDVPLGAFLSGGLDSTAVVSAASRLSPHLKTFSIGFRDDPFYDESRYAEEVARIFHTEHSTISMNTKDLLDVIPGVLEYSGEPFGDSSAIAVYLLSREVGRSVRVALSGDGGDELLGGYNKHRAENLIRRKKWLLRPLTLINPLLSSLPQGRHHKIVNQIRQLNRLLQGVSLAGEERYWQWAGFMPEERVKELVTFAGNLKEYTSRKNEILEELKTRPGDFNAILNTDLGLVLSGDMLVKTDRMSMANALEIRSPFLDHQLVRFCSTLSPNWKVRGSTTKVILRQYLKSQVPGHIINRPKQGFEVPLQRWLNSDLKEKYLTELFNKDFIEQQGIFDPTSLSQLLKKLETDNPGDSPIQIWSLLVFQYWWKKYMEQ